MSEFFLWPKFSGEGVKVELNFYQYATKPSFKKAAGVDTWKFAKRVDLASLKSNVDN